MLATLVIGLREGLEAALIVGMIAAFLRRNGIPLKPMWLGVGAAVLLSALVGITLELVSAALPQQQQEAMETVIGAVAVVIVTFMILWMSKNSRSMKSTLEQHADAALNGGSVMALAGMAFLAVLREGIETAVFMVAAFQSSLDPLQAGLGAVLGLLIASGLGVLLFRGAIKLNLAKFFKATGAFLVFVAAGLVMKSLRTAHEAGWLNAGQGTTLDLSWLAPNGSTRAAIITGVFGIPADPRVVEVLGWALYLVPMLLFILWPQRWRVSAAVRPRLQVAAAGVLAVGAVTLAIAAPLSVPSATLATGSTPAITSAGSAAGSLRLAQAGHAAAANLGDTSVPAAGSGTTASGSGSGVGTNKVLVFTSADGVTSSYPLTLQGTESHAGRTTTAYTADASAAVSSNSSSSADPASLTASELAALNGGRMPVGINAGNNPGPFATAWQHKGSLTVWLANDTELVDAVRTDATTLTLSGGGLSSPRTVTLDGSSNWQVPQDHVMAAVAELDTVQLAKTDNVLWGIYLPATFLVAAAVLAFVGLRSKRQLLTAAPAP